MIGAKPNVANFKKVWRILKYIFRPANAFVYVGLILYIAELNNASTMEDYFYIMRYYTMINLAFNAIYYAIAVPLDLFNMKGTRTTVSIVAFTSSVATAVLYWGLNFYSPGATSTTQDPLTTTSWWPHVGHTWPAIANFIDLLLSKPGRPNYRQALLLILIVAFGYGILLDASAKRGVYIYDFIANLSQNQRYIFYFATLGAVFICFAVISSITFILYMLCNELNSDENSDPPRRWYQRKPAPVLPTEQPTTSKPKNDDKCNSGTQQHHFFFHNVKLPTMGLGSSANNSSNGNNNKANVAMTPTAPAPVNPKNMKTETPINVKSSKTSDPDKAGATIKKPAPEPSVINMIPFAASASVPTESTGRAGKLAGYFGRKKSEGTPASLDFDEN